LEKINNRKSRRGPKESNSKLDWGGKKKGPKKRSERGGKGVNYRMRVKGIR